MYIIIIIAVVDVVDCTCVAVEPGPQPVTGEEGEAGHLHRLRVSAPGPATLLLSPRAPVRGRHLPERVQRQRPGAPDAQRGRGQGHDLQPLLVAVLAHVRGDGDAFSLPELFSVGEVQRCDVSAAHDGGLCDGTRTASYRHR